VLIFTIIKNYKHPNTPKKARFLALINYNQRAFNPRLKAVFFAEAGVFKSAGYRILKSNDPRTYKNQDYAETKGRPYKITPQQSRRIVQIIKNSGFDLITQTYGQLTICTKVTNVCARTVKNSLPFNFKKHPAALRRYVTPNLANLRKNWCLAV